MATSGSSPPPEPPSPDPAPPVIIELEADMPPPPADAAEASAELRAAIQGDPPPARFPDPSPNPSPNPNPSPSPSPTPNPTTAASTGGRTGHPERSAPLSDAKGSREVERATDDDGTDEPTVRRRRWPLALGALAAVAAVITALVLAGRVNHRQLYLSCGPTEITALRGRSFPPWGREPIGGPGWKPIVIPAATECTDRATREPAELEGWYLDALVEQATGALATEGGDVDRAEVQLQQALLLARSPERRDQRKDIDRLLADVTYGRGARQIGTAIATLRDAAARFDDAAGRRPVHAADAAAWAAFARAMADKLDSGPTPELAPSLLSPVTPTRPPAPPGVALPVEPTTDGGTWPAPPIDAGVPGIPSGGVLM